MIGLNVKSYFNEVLLNVVKVTACASVVPAILAFFTEESFIRLIYTTIVGVIFAGSSILYIGCTEKERSMVYRKIRTFVISKFKLHD